MLHALAMLIAVLARHNKACRFSERGRLRGNGRRHHRARTGSPTSASLSLSSSAVREGARSQPDRVCDRRGIAVWRRAPCPAPWPVGSPRRPGSASPPPWCPTAHAGEALPPGPVEGIRTVPDRDDHRRRSRPSNRWSRARPVRRPACGATIRSAGRRNRGTTCQHRQPVRLHAPWPRPNTTRCCGSVLATGRARHLVCVTGSSGSCAATPAR